MDEGRESWINQAEAQSLGPSIQMLGRTDPGPLHEGPGHLLESMACVLIVWIQFLSWRTLRITPNIQLRQVHPRPPLCDESPCTACHHGRQWTREGVRHHELRVPLPEAPGLKALAIDYSHY